MTRPPLVVVDIEAAGLHGPAYAFGAIVIDDGRITERHMEWCRPEVACSGREGNHLEGLVWANAKVVPQLVMVTDAPTVTSPAQVRGRFWSVWRAVADRGGLLAGDCVWPVESGFLADCIADDPGGRWWAGPVPLLDIATLRFAGLAAEVEDRHQPLIDATNSWVAMRPWWLGERP